jgi:hypothetical protein
MGRQLGHQVASPGLNAEALREVKQLADRVGGLEQLKELVNVLLDLRQ